LKQCLLSGWATRRTKASVLCHSPAASSSLIPHTDHPINSLRRSGAKSFRLLATWDHNDRTEGLNRRPGPLLRSLDDSADFCRFGDLVVAGDFNNNPRWDRPNGPNNMSVLAQELARRQLVSLYHHGTGEAFGGELRGTYWHYRRRDMPYHIDYLFVPMTWLKDLVAFELGDYDAWCRAAAWDPLRTCVAYPRTIAALNHPASGKIGTGGCRRSYPMSVAGPSSDSPAKRISIRSPRRRG
jgi:hypothetical protein